MATIEIPAQFELKSAVIANKHTGHITVPDAWTGADFEEYFQASQGITKTDTRHPWLKQWDWAKGRIVEWAIDGLPTNPNQIEDDDVPWPLMNFVSRSLRNAMFAYMDEYVDERKSALEYPTADSLTAGEFFAWEKAVRDMPDDDERSNLLKAWQCGHPLVRGWINGKTPAVDGLDVDLALIAAVNDIIDQCVGPALDLGNLPAPPGAAST